MREFEIKLYEPRGTVAEEHPEIAAMWQPTANDCVVLMKSRAEGGDVLP